MSVRSLGWCPVLAGPDADEEVITMVIDNISRTFQQASGAERGFLDLLKPSPERLFQRLCLVIGINVAAQMTGANVISHYGKTIFKEFLNLEDTKAFFLNAGVLTWKILAAVSAYLNVDRFSRKPLFIASV